MRQDVKQQLITYIIDNQEKFYRLAYSYVHDREEALDVVQNAIVKALEKHDGIRSESAIKAWFYRVLVNESLNSLSRNKREVNWEPEEFRDIPAEEQSQPDDDLYDQIDRLPTNLKTVVILRFYEDLTLEEIAKVTEISLSTVKYRLYAGLKKLRVFLKEEDNVS